VTAETLQQAAGKHKISPSEARKILEVDSSATLGEIRKVLLGFSLVCPILDERMQAEDP
jgi:hypothetical protein